MDAYLAIASKRDVREYDEREIPVEVARRILDAGRLAGSARNRQPWRFHVVEERAAIESLARAVFAPANVLGARLVVVVVTAGKGPTSFDAGRAAQNMMLAAWNEGVVSCPNGIADPEGAAGVLALSEDEQLAIVLSFGYPATPRNPERRTAAEWSRRADRKPLDEIVVRR